MAVGGLVLVLLVILGLLLGWFGGGRPSVAAAPQGTPAQPSPKPAQPPPAPPGIMPGATPPPSQPLPPGPAATQQPAKDKPPQEQKPPLTDDFTKWKGADWSRARRENHPKLREGIVYLGSEKFSGNEKVAKGLTGLLKPLPPEKPAETPATPAPGTPGVPAPARGMPVPPRGMPGPMPGLPGLPPSTPGAGSSPNGRPYNATDLAALVDAIVTALGNNGSDVARKTIGEVLAGTFATDDDKTAVESAVKALVAHPSADNDALLIRLLLSPEGVRSADHEGPWPAKQLSSKTFELIKQSPSCGLRTRMAEAVIERRETLNAEDSMHKFLLEDNPLNGGAQAVFYRKAIGIKAEIKTKLEGQLLKYSSLALGRYLGIPDQFQAGGGGTTLPTSPAPKPTDRFAPVPGGVPGPGQVPGLPGAPPSVPSPNPGVSPPAGQAPKPAEVDLAAELAGYLWTKEFRAAFEPELGKSSLEKQSQLLLLAGTIPQDSTRALLAKLLNKRAASEEPTPLKTAGFVDKVVTDPALLVPLKMLPWKDLKPPRPGATVDKNKLPEAKRKEQEAKEKWRDFSQEMAEAWCKRLYAAAQAKQEKVQARADASGAPVATPMKLPSGFRFKQDAIKATYHLAWPDEAPPELAKLNPGLLSIYYVRVEENAKLKKTTDSYCLQAGAKKNEVRTTDKGAWIYNCRVAPDRKDRRRSVDVLITNSQGSATTPGLGMPGAGERGKAAAKADTETDLVIEVLVVEVKESGKE